MPPSGTDQAYAGPERYSTLAAAMAGRPIRVVEGGIDRPYTDGTTIFVPPGTGELALAAIVVQAGLLAIGSLEPGIMAKVAGRRALRHRYLMLEAARASRALGHAMPRSVVDLIVELYAGPAPNSAAHSYALAASDRAVPEAPAWMGTIRPITVLGQDLRGATRSDKDLREPPPDGGPPELDDDEKSESSTILQLMSVPIGRPRSSLLQNLLGLGRVSKPQEGGGGDELEIGGSVAAAVGREARPAATPSWMGLAASDTPGAGRRYPEWDHVRRTYQRDWCTVTEFDPRPPAEERACDPVDDPQLRRELTRLGLTHERYRRQPEGDTLDVTALVEHVVDARAGVSPDDRVYETKRRTGRDLGVVVLLDATGSTATSAEAFKIFEEQRRLVARLTGTLAELDDRVATYGFSSRGRENVRFLRVKDFDGRYDHAAQQRLAALEPEGFTRLGAAIRHATHLVSTRAGTASKLLVVVGDGLPYDTGYEGRYAHEDSRRALREAVVQGVGCACVSVGSDTDEAVIERVWGHVPFRRLNEASGFGGEALPSSARRSGKPPPSGAERVVSRDERGEHDESAC